MFEINEKLLEKLVEEANNNFRTPEMQLNFILHNYFNNVPASVEQAQVKIITKTIDKEDDDWKSVYNSTVIKEDDSYTNNFSDARRAYEIANAKKNKEIKPTDEQLVAIYDAAQKRKEEKQKNEQ